MYEGARRRVKRAGRMEKRDFPSNNLVSYLHSSVSFICWYFRELMLARFIHGKVNRLEVDKESGIFYLLPSSISSLSLGYSLPSPL